MTIGDKIRSMTDEELAVLIANIIAGRDQIIARKIAKLELGIEFPYDSVFEHLQWLQKEETEL